MNYSARNNSNSCNLTDRDKATLELISKAGVVTTKQVQKIYNSG
jgi:hypothetical protein